MKMPGAGAGAGAPPNGVVAEKKGLVVSQGGSGVVPAIRPRGVSTHAGVVGPGVVGGAAVVVGGGSVGAGVIFHNGGGPSVGSELMLTSGSPGIPGRGLAGGGGNGGGTAAGIIGGGGGGIGG